jgi:hypothetical protein
MRLDIPYAGQYSCSAKSRNSGIVIKNVFIGAGKETKISTDAASVYLPNVSHPIVVDYETEEIINIPFINKEKYGITEIKIGSIKNGNYTLKLNVRSEQGANLAIFMLKKKLENNSINFFADLKTDLNNFVFSSIFSKNSGSNYNYEKSFSISNFDNPEYYLYIVSTDSNYSKVKTSFTDLTIKQVVGNEDIGFYCYLDKKKGVVSENFVSSIKKISDVEYRLQLPNKYQGVLAFNQTYDKDWQAYTYINGKKHIFNHFSNTYANAWQIDAPIKDEITVEFIRQKLAFRNAVFCILGFIILFIIYLKISSKK